MRVVASGAWGCSLWRVGLQPLVRGAAASGAWGCGTSEKTSSMKAAVSVVCPAIELSILASLSSLIEIPTWLESELWSELGLG